MLGSLNPAAGSRGGCTDASPRGGPPGFVTVLDENHIAFGDLSGNNRLDSDTNIVEHPEVGILFLVPGVGETLRVNGRASVTTDPSVLDRTAIGGVQPKVAVVVAVEKCFIHCAKALRRSGVWDTGTWAAEGARPSAAVVIANQSQARHRPRPHRGGPRGRLPGDALARGWSLNPRANPTI